MTEVKKKKASNFARRLPFILIFLIGLGVLVYPLISRLYYRVESSAEIQTFKDEVSKLDQEEIDRRMDLARAYNESLVNQVTEDPYSEDRQAAGRAEYARMLEVKEMIGHVQIPKIDIDIPVYAGTADAILQKGAGHLEGTSLPIGGNSTHSVITAHSGLPEARLFSDLEDLIVGDKFYIHNLGETMAYQIDQIKVIEPTDFSDLLISPGHDYVTLLTCTPIMINSHRLILRGHRIDYVPAVEERYIAENQSAYMYKYLFMAALVLIALLVIGNIRLRRKQKRVDARLRALEESTKVNEAENLIGNESEVRDE